MWTVRIRERLKALEASDPKRSLFGASRRRYELGKRLSDAEVESFERRFGIVLPEEYRAFLIELGDGGAGPFGCLFRLGYYMDGHDLVPWEEGLTVGVLAKPFPLSAAWNLPPDYLGDEEDFQPSPAVVSAAAEELERLGVDIGREKIGQPIKNPFTKESGTITLGGLVSVAYYSLALLNGALPLATEGCNLTQWLVVTGRERGHIWRDLRADAGGLAPLDGGDGARVSFRQWYEAWLDEVEAGMGGGRQAG